MPPPSPGNGNVDVWAGVPPAVIDNIRAQYRSGDAAQIAQANATVQSLYTRALNASAPMTPLQQSQMQHSIAETRKLLAEMPLTREQTTASLNTLIDNGRRIVDMPGFDRALDMSRMQMNISPAAGYGGNALSPVVQGLRLATASDPRWGTFDEITNLQARLDLQAGRAFLKGQGQVSNFERQMVKDAIGQLGRASGAADFQFRLNSVQDMINTLEDGGHLREGRTYGSRPTNDEIFAVINRDTRQVNQQALQELAARYHVQPRDLDRYVYNVASEATTPENRVTQMNRDEAAAFVNSQLPSGGGNTLMRALRSVGIASPAPQASALPQVPALPNPAPAEQDPEIAALDRQLAGLPPEQRALFINALRQQRQQGAAPSPNVTGGSF
jgi:hypothetical protein